MIVFRRICQATRTGETVLLTGVTMGGGPSQWAAQEHLRAGYSVFATPDAARSFNDDLDAVQDMGIQVISDDEIKRLPESVKHLELCDFDFEAIDSAFGKFGVSLRELDALAVAVFDHGNAPPEYSDRQFRFDYLDDLIRKHNRLSAFAFLADEVPPIMTRLQAVVQSAKSFGSSLLESIPTVLMDTAPAAILGATYDPKVCARQRILITNVGNFHTLAFRLGPSGIEGVFEHHTGLIDLHKLETLLLGLADGSLEHSDVFDDHGHGALVYNQNPLNLFESSIPGNNGYGIVVTGPRRNMMRNSSLRPYFAVPFGDMMITGCFGLLAAVADIIPELSDAIRSSLRGAGGSGTPPWEIN